MPIKKYSELSETKVEMDGILNVIKKVPVGPAEGCVNPRHLDGGLRILAPGLRRGDRHLVREPVDPEVEHHRESEGEQRPLLTTEQPSDTDKDPTEQGKQRNGLEIVGHGRSVPLRPGFSCPEVELIAEISSARGGARKTLQHFLHSRHHAE